MKAKIKKTGEIVNLASYARIALEQCDSYGNPIELKPEEVEIIQEPTEDEYWEDVRERAAIAVMQGMLADPTRAGNHEEYAEAAVSFADALIEELKKKQS
jgi:hypothetical protein